MRVLLFASCVAIATTSFSAEPTASSPLTKDSVVEGKTLQQWSIEARDKDPKTASHAMMILHLYGPAATSVFAGIMKSRACRLVLLPTRRARNWPLSPPFRRSRRSLRCSTTHYPRPVRQRSGVSE